jgi:protein involved in polysaccharide export with SLBB domain
MTLKDLVHLAGGLDDGAYLVQAEVARLPDERQPGVLARTLTVALDSTYLLERGLDGKYVGPPGMKPTAVVAPEFVLKPYDNVLILHEPDWQLERRVAILGEVRFPGVYTLQTKQDRLTELLARAGGLTTRAYPEGAVFNRPDSHLGRVGLDLRAAIRDARHRDNFVLFAGDTLYIPPFKPTVKIEGAVHSPIAVAYVPGKSLDYYIDAAGGPTFAADIKRAYVRQPNGVVEPYKSRAWMIPDGNPTPQAGALVVVPSKDPNDRKDWAAIASSVAQIIVGMVAVLAIATK